MVKELRTKYPESFLLEYIDRCRAGEIIVGYEIKQNFDMLLEHFLDPSITIDFREAHKRINFIETKCKHFEAPFAGKPFILELWQKAIIESIYIFYIYDEELSRLARLKQELLLIVGKKNGKTPFIASLCLAEFFCGMMGTKILCSSNDYEQASLMYEAINAMREESPSLARVSRANIKGIFFGNPKKVKRKGKFSYQNKGSIKRISARKKANEGRNIAVGAVDEVHELLDDTPIMPIRMGLSTQDEPLYIEISTEGFVNDGYLDDRLKMARKALDKQEEKPRWSIWLYTQDSEKEIWQNEQSWYKSNPNLGVSKKWSYLRQIVDEARSNKKTRVSVLAKDFNIRQKATQVWLSIEALKPTPYYDIEEFRGCFAIGGVDLSKTGDLACARAMLMRKNDSVKYMISRYFIPQSKLEKIPTKYKERYNEWIKQGYITVCNGNENDFSLISKWYVDLWTEKQIKTAYTGYDKWSANYWVKEMKEIHGFENLFSISQEGDSLSQAMDLLEADLSAGLVNYNNNPVDLHCLENTGIKFNSKGNSMPCKIEEEAKIDGTATMLICYKTYINNRSSFLDLVNR